MIVYLRDKNKNDLSINSDGSLTTNQSITQTNVLTNATITSSSSTTYTLTNKYDNLTLLIAVTGSITGTNPTLQFKVSMLEPQSDTTITSFSSDTLSSTTTSSYVTIINNVFSNKVKIEWNVSGTVPSFAGVYVTLLVM
ncbi:MAG: hypothetical protein QXO37_02470 [Candidatus Nitrosocaldaceae archaeon]